MTSASLAATGSVEIYGDETPSPPRILRENLAMGHDDRIGVSMLDDAISSWWSWREQTEGAPNWSTFKPFNHPRLLPDIMVYEQIGGRFRCAIIGEVAGNRLPINIAGRFIDEAMPPENLTDVSMRLTRALDRQVPNFVEKTMAWYVGYDLVSYRALQLPFTADEGKNPRILSIMDFRVEKRTL